MHRRFVIPILLLTCLALPSLSRAQAEQADLSKTPAWLWSDDQRLVARFAPGAVAQRAARAAAAYEPPSGHRALHADHAPAHYDYVSGATDPQLFLPIELYRDLLQLLFQNNPTTSPSPAQSLIADSWHRLGLPSDPDSLLGPDGRSFLQLFETDRQQSLEWRESNTRRSMPTRTLHPQRAANELQACRQVVGSLERLLASFTPEQRTAFLRLLYESVAPTRLTQSFGPSAPDELRRLKAGCP